eukprot:871341_1
MACRGEKVSGLIIDAICSGNCFSSSYVSSWSLPFILRIECDLTACSSTNAGIPFKYDRCNCTNDTNSTRFWTRSNGFTRRDNKIWIVWFVHYSSCSINSAMSAFT